MKKIAIILAMVCFVLSLAIAQEDYKPSVTIGGNAKLKIGFNLDKNIFGWLNSFDPTLKITFVPKVSKEKSGEGMYGYIKLIDLKIEETFTIVKPKITAKLVFPSFELLFVDEAGGDAPAAGDQTKQIEGGNYSLVTLENFDKDLKFEVGAKGDAGSFLKGTINVAPISFALSVSSDNKYCDGTGSNNFFFGAAPKVTLGDLTIEANSVFSNKTGFNPAFGAKVSYKMALDDKISLQPSVAFDFVAGSTDATTNYGAGVGLYAIWGAKTTWALNLKTAPTLCSTWDDDKDIQSGAGISASWQKNNTINLLAMASDGKGDDGLIPGMGFAAAFELGDVTKVVKTTMAAKAMVSLKAGDISPYAGVRWNDSVSTGKLAARVGVDVANVMPNTALNFEYNSFELLAAGKSNGVLVGTVTVSF